MSEPISKEFRTEILKRIEASEREHQVKVLYAIESGSRAWGFASQNSDYDVRFIYVHEKNWYLGIDLENKPDVIEYPIVDEIDINGWDIRKALKLFNASNPAFLEWLQSPIVYRDQDNFAQKCRDLIPQIYQTFKGMHHYLNMAIGNYKKYLQSERVYLKKYFYVLRPLLAIQWIEKYQEAPPIVFEQLRTLIQDDQELMHSIDLALEKKRKSQEKDLIEKIPVLDKFIEVELNRLENYSVKANSKNQNIHQLNQIFRSHL